MANPTLQCNFSEIPSANTVQGSNKYGFYPMVDLEKLLVILTIDNAQVLRINPELIEMSQGNDHHGQRASQLWQLLVTIKIK